MTAAKKEKWLGGYVRRGVKGATFVIERWIDGTHWHVSTKCRTQRAALKELERFEADPAGYRLARSRKTVATAVTPELIDEYLEHMKARELDPPYIDSHEYYLGQVMVALEGRELGRITYAELVDVMKAAEDPQFKSAAAARRRALKAFASWLRREKGLLTRLNDPTLDLRVAHVATPEKNRRKKAMTLETVERIVATLSEDVRDVAIVLAATGAHITELRRLHAGHGQLSQPAEWQEGVLLNVVVRHKNRKKDGGNHVVALTDPTAVEALQRILKRPAFPSRGHYHHEVRKARAAVGVAFNLGWLRHSVSTWLALKRTPEQQIANQLGHVDTKMVRSTYIDLGLAAHPVPIPRLRLVSGGGGEG